jgi:hypothetical protein
VVGVLTVLGAGPAVHAQFLNWFMLIHCAGDNTNHSDGSMPDQESYTNAAGEDVNQCHGTPGEMGACSASNYSAGCMVKPNGAALCFASYQCGGETGTINCGGADQEAIAGTFTEGDNTYGFVLCEYAGTDTVVDRHVCEQ